MAVPLKLDITTGDKVTPEAIRFRYRLLLEDKEISVLAYNLETIMAEKLESIVSRGDQNTRLRDYYDVYILMKLQYKNIEPEYLKAALDATSKNRGTSEILRDYKNIIAVVKKSGVMNSQWRTYQKNFEYAADISFDEVCDAVVHMMDMYSL